MWRLLMVLTVSAAWGGAAGESFLSDITHNLRSEIAGVMEMANVTYSTPVINTTYRASVEFDMRAMGSLYNSTHLVIDFIANKQAYPEGIVSVSDGHLEIASPREHWRELLTHYAGPTAVVVLAALLAVSLLLAGLFWCCCNWCKSGRRRRAFDRKYDSCLKGMLAILLIALLTLFLFGVVCAFATDAQLETSASEAPAAVRAGLRDAREFLNATQAHARHLLVNNFRELELKVNGLLTSSGLAVSVQLGAVARGAAVSALAQLVARLDDVQAGLKEVTRLTADLRARADHLNSGLRKVKRQLLETLAECEEAPCVRLQQKHKIGELDTEIQYNQMPDVSDLLGNVTLLLEGNIKGEVEEGQRVFRDIQRAVQREVDRHVPALQAALHDTGRRLARVADEISALAGNASAELRRREGAADGLQRAFERYGPYRRYLGLAAASALLLITCILALGLTCGVCGKRPDVYGASDCCNKGAAATCLLCGTGCMFVAGALAAAVALAYFAAGVTSQRFLCDPLYEPRGNRLLEDVDRFVELERALFNEHSDPSFNISSVLQRCYQNYTIYETLQLWRLYDVEKLVTEARREVTAQTATLRASWSVGTVTILKPSARDKLRQLAEAGLSDFNFDRILNALETNMTSLSLEQLAAQLESTAAGVEERSGYSRVAPSLQRAAQHLRALHADAVQPLLRDAAALQKTATELRDGLRFNHSSLREAVSYLVYETAQAERFLNTQGPALVHNITLEFASVVSSLVDGYVEVVRRGAREEVGRCGPLARAVNATRDAACHKILMPVNGYWLSVSWCVALLVPLMVVAQRLARLYRHVDPYPGPLVEAEYLYDAYADRDNVPLANAYKAEKRAGRRARGGAGPGGGAGGGGGGAGGGAGGGGGEVGEGRAAAPGPALAPPLYAHHARRYNDMAPKHWEEGPPRYHGPTEYERPPPYYYPGPNDRQ